MNKNYPIDHDILVSIAENRFKYHETYVKIDCWNMLKYLTRTKGQDEDDIYKAVDYYYHLKSRWFYSDEIVRTAIPYTDALNELSQHLTASGYTFFDRDEDEFKAIIDYIPEGKRRILSL